MGTGESVIASPVRKKNNHLFLRDSSTDSLKLETSRKASTMELDSEKEKRRFRVDEDRKVRTGFPDFSETEPLETNYEEKMIHLTTNV